MIIFNSDNRNFTASFQGDVYETAYDPSISVRSFCLYEKSKSMLRLKRRNSNVVTLFVVTFEKDGVTHTLSLFTDPNGEVNVPLRNVVARFYDKQSPLTNIGITATMREVSDPDTVVDSIEQMTPYLFGGISYMDALAPYHGYKGLVDTPMIVLPPNVMYHNPYVTSKVSPFHFESNYNNFHFSLQGLEWKTGNNYTLQPIGHRHNTYIIPSIVETEIRLLRNGDELCAWQLKRPTGCERMATFMWTSLTGASRMHSFPVVSFIDEYEDTISIDSAGDGFPTRKNAIKGVVCRITGLTSYSVWYYQDLLMSSDVHCLIQPSLDFESDIYHENSECEIIGSNTATPEGNGFFSFEFTAKLRHYDSV